MQPDYFLAGIVLTASTIIAIIVDGLYNIGKQLNRRAVAKRNRRTAIASLPAVAKRAVAARKRSSFLSTWNDYTEKQITRAGLKIRPAQLTIIAALLVCLGTPFLYFLSKDLILTFVTGLVLASIPILYLNNAVQRHYFKINEQLPVAIQLFTVEFEIAKSIPESLMRCSKGVETPLSKYIEQCASELMAGKNPRDVFQKFADNLGCEYGRLWTQMLLASTEDSTTVKIMPRLITRLSGQRILQQSNVKELAGIKRIGTILNILVVPALLVVLVNFPGASELYTMPIGKIIIIVAFMSLPLGVLLDQILRKVDL